MKFPLLSYALLASSFFLLLHEWERLPDGKLHVTALDVGQGDSILITTPGNQHVLIDGGPDLTVLERLGEKFPFFSRRIDLLVLTHTHADHLASFPEVLRRYDVQNILMTGVAGESASYSAFLDAVRESGPHVILARSDRDLDFGKGVFFDVLWPTEDSLGISDKRDPHLFSLVAKLTWKNHPTSRFPLRSSSFEGQAALRGASVLHTGDIEEKVEEALLKDGDDLRADFLKVPHHGSKTSSSTGFLLAVAPDLAVISVGAGNTYGHPNEGVLQRYEALGIPVRRTDREGTIDVDFE